MSVFSVKNALGQVYKEIVEGCTSVEAFIAQHFGSIVPSEHGLEVTMEKDAVDTIGATIGTAIDPVSQETENFSTSASVTPEQFAALQTAQQAQAASAAATAAANEAAIQAAKVEGAQEQQASDQTQINAMVAAQPAPVAVQPTVVIPVPVPVPEKKGLLGTLLSPVTTVVGDAATVAKDGINTVATVATTGVDTVAGALSSTVGAVGAIGASVVAATGVLVPVATELAPVVLL
jgi:hypothetical protein